MAQRGPQRVSAAGSLGALIAAPIGQVATRPANHAAGSIASASTTKATMPTRQP